MTTVEEIEGVSWPPAAPTDTFLVRRCTALRRTPLAKLTTEDLRIMLGQRIGVPILLPLAVEALVADPLAEGDLYPGDLLRTVVRLPASDWRPVDRDRLVAALRAKGLPDHPPLRDFLAQANWSAA